MATLKIGGRDLELRELVLDDGPALDEAIKALDSGDGISKIARAADVILLFVGHHEGVDRAWLGKNLPLHSGKLKAMLDACLEAVGVVQPKGASPGEAAGP